MTEDFGEPTFMASSTNFDLGPNFSMLIPQDTFDLARPTITHVSQPLVFPPNGLKNLVPIYGSYPIPPNSPIAPETFTKNFSLAGQGGVSTLAKWEF